MPPQAKTISTTRHAQGYRTIHIGDWYHPIYMIILSHIKAYLWKQVESFNQTAWIIINVTDLHIITYTITLVANGIPMAKEYTMKQAD